MGGLRGNLDPELLQAGHLSRSTLAASALQAVARQFRRILALALELLSLRIALALCLREPIGPARVPGQDCLVIHP